MPFGGGTDPERGRPLPLLLGLAAAVFAIAFAFAPVEQQTSEYAWSASDDGPRVPLLLIERVPDRFELSFPCRYAEGSDRPLFASSRQPSEVPALTVGVAEGRLVVAVPTAPGEADGDRRNLELDVAGIEDCDVVLVYDREAGELSLHAGGKARHLKVGDEAFELTGFHWATEELDEVSGIVTTAPVSMMRNSPIQKGLLAGIMLLGLGAIGVRVAEGWRWRPRPGWWRPHPSELAVAAVALTVALVDLPRVDDGRILSRARQLAGPDLSANVPILIEDRILPQRWLYEWSLGTTVGWSDVIVVVRSLSVVLAIAGWVLFRRLVLPRLTSGRPDAAPTWTAWAVHAVFVVAWFATLRPEPLVVLLTVAVLAVLASWPEEPRAWPYVVLFGCVGLALATHAVGFATALAATPAVARLIPELRAAPARVLTGGAWGGALAVLAVFLGSNLPRTLEAVRSYQEGGIHDLGVFDSLQYVQTIDDSTAPMMLSFGLATIAAAALFASTWRRLSEGFRWPSDGVVLGATLIPFGLLFPPSKWIWHLTILAPVALVGWVLVASRLGDRAGRADRGRWLPRSSAVVGLTGAVLGLLLAWALHPAWHPRMLPGDWRPTGLRRVRPELWSDRVSWLVGPEVRWWLWALILVATGLVIAGYLERRRSATGSGGVAIAGIVASCLVVVSGIQLTPPVLDAVASGSEWTFVRQSVVGIVSREAACGVPAATPAVVEHAEAVGRPVNEGGIAGHSMVYVYAPCHEAMSQRDGAWQVPSLLMGSPRQDQRRASVEYDLVGIGCHPFQGDDRGRLCFSAYEAEAPVLGPSRVTWTVSHRHPR